MHRENADKRKFCNRGRRTSQTILMVGLGCKGCDQARATPMVGTRAAGSSARMDASASLYGMRSIDSMAAQIVAQCGLPKPPTNRQRSHRYQAVRSVGQVWVRLCHNRSGFEIKWGVDAEDGSFFALRLKTTALGIEAALYFNRRWHPTPLLPSGLSPAVVRKLKERFGPVFEAAQTKRFARVLADARAEGETTLSD